MTEDQGTVMFIAMIIFSLFSFLFTTSQRSQEDKNVAVAGICMGLASAFFLFWILSL